MNIFEALRADHDKQRAMLDNVEKTEGADGARGTLFNDLKAELANHAAAEEQHFYAPLMAHDVMLDKARHSVAEHKEIDDRVEELENTDHSNPQWLIRFKDLKHRVLHHLEEEEREVFQMAGKSLSEDQKTSLANTYQADIQSRRS